MYYAAFSTARKSVPDGYPENILEIEVREAVKRLGIPQDNLIVYNYEVRKLNFYRQEILEELVKLRERIQPDLVLLPSPNDLHQDHYTVSIEGMRAFKFISILGYELPWNNINFQTQAFVKLEKSHIDKKIDALKAYESQKSKLYSTEDFIYSWARTRGTQIGAQFAETMEVVRWII